MTPFLLASGSKLIMTAISSLTALAVCAFVTWQLRHVFSFFCGPDEVLVLSGRAHRRSDGTQVGYRVVKGGHAWRVPFVEDVKRLSLEPLTANARAGSAVLKTGERFDIEFKAQVRISPRDSLLSNAIERFLGRSTSEVCEAASERLEAHMRAASCGLTVEGLANLDDKSLTALLQEHAADDLASLGLELLSASDLEGVEL